MLTRKNDMKVPESPQASKMDNFLGTITNVYKELPSIAQTLSSIVVFRGSAWTANICQNKLLKGLLHPISYCEQKNSCVKFKKQALPIGASKNWWEKLGTWSQ